MRPSHFKCERDIVLHTKHVTNSIPYENSEYIMPLDISLNENQELDVKSKMMVTSSETLFCLREKIHTGELYFIDDELMEGKFSMENVVTFL